jgi:catechol 2,3-dioxygenase-like lactoylglutathione lyase family enzyme
MLGDAALIGFIPVTDLDPARVFYESTLGLVVVDESPFALVLDANATMLRVTPVGDFRPQSFTIAGWSVADIDATVAGLTARGVAFTRYEGMDQDRQGIWTSPSGDRVAWFTDPDGNTLSLTGFLAGAEPAQP